LIVGISLAPQIGAFLIIWALRIRCVLWLLSTVGRLRVIVEFLLRAIPSIGWIGGLLLLVLYIFGVMGTQLFGASFPDWFGNVGRTMYTLLQIMTLEARSMELARPVMEVYPYAWLYFIPFILITPFTVLNLFIGIIVNTMQSLHWQEEEATRIDLENHARAERKHMVELLEDLHAKVDRMEKDQKGNVALRFARDRIVKEA
jgi:voltage-gated sodium channel